MYKLKNAHLTQYNIPLNDHIKIDNFLFYGTTLWTHIKPDNAGYIYSTMNDYAKIYTDNHSNLTIEKGNKIHFDQMEKLTKFLNSNGDSEIVVITHHCPRKKTKS